MAGIGVGAGARLRRLDHELPLVPFIDFLLCLIAFLLVTAVWSRMARLPADASLGRPEAGPPVATAKQLHVDMRRDDQFVLSWKQGQTVLDMTSIPRRPVLHGDDAQPTYPDLAHAVARQWSLHAPHRAPSDRTANRAVLHAAGGTEFEHVAAVLDAIAAPKRALAAADSQVEVPAFNVVFAAD
jgi:biopolymer transport protein ExbD